MGSESIQTPLLFAHFTINTDFEIDEIYFLTINPQTITLGVKIKKTLNFQIKIEIEISCKYTVPNI